MLAIAAGDRGDKAMHPSQAALVSPSFLKEILKCAVGDQLGYPPGEMVRGSLEGAFKPVFSKRNGIP